jgi:Phage terminase, small subunit
MAKKPTLTVVDIASSNPLAPPASLGKAGAKLWQSIQGDYRIDDSGGIEMLLQICSAADRADECSEIIARDGPVIRSKAGLKDHPLLKHELQARSFIVRSLHRLGLDIEPTRNVVGRPPGTFTSRG